MYPGTTFFISIPKLETSGSGISDQISKIIHGLKRYSPEAEVTFLGESLIEKKWLQLLAQKVLSEETCFLKFEIIPYEFFISYTQGDLLFGVNIFDYFAEKKPAANEAEKRMKGLAKIFETNLQQKPFPPY